MNNWIKVNASLRTNPKLVTVASQLSVTCVTALGAICHVWMIADEHADENGLIKFMSAASLDALIGIEGLAKALESVGWLEDLGVSLVMPDYAQHNGSTGKTRAEAQKRKAKSRAKVTPVTKKRDAGHKRVIPDDIREREDSLLDKSKREVPAVSKSKAKGSVEEIETYCVEQGLPAGQGQLLVDKWEGSGWKVGGNSMKCWRSTIRNWKSRGYLPMSTARGPDRSAGQIQGDSTAAYVANQKQRQAESDARIAASTPEGEIF
tara:strand:+ start:640 stop:1428 length:789 start_codon:yes stop_codon:yes gene_type:complete